MGNEAPVTRGELEEIKKETERGFQHLQGQIEALKAGKTPPPEPKASKGWSLF